MEFEFGEDLVPLPPMKYLDYKDLQDGEEIFGILVDRFQQETGRFGKQKKYRIYRYWGSEYAEELVCLNGTVTLDGMLAQVKDGTFLKIVYFGKVLTGEYDDQGNAKSEHRFKVTPAKDNDLIRRLREQASVVCGPTPQPKGKQESTQEPKSDLMSGPEIPF